MCEENLGILPSIPHGLIKNEKECLEEIYQWDYLKDEDRMTEDEYRDKVYDIMKDKYGWNVDFEHNEQGWYDPFIEDCWKDGVELEACAEGLLSAG